MGKPKSYDDYTPEDWEAQVKADEFDALYEQNRQAGQDKEENGDWRG